MLKKINRYIFTLSMIILIISVTMLTIVFYNSAVSDETNSQKTKLSFLKKAYELNGIDYFKDLESSGDRVTIIDKDGTVIYDNEVDTSKMENHSNREEVIGAIKDGYSSSYRFSDTKYEHRLYSAILLDNGMVLRISKSRTIIFNSIIEFMKYSIIIIIFAALLSFLFSKKMSKKILEPFSKINLDKPLENNVYDELSPFLLKIDTQYKKIDSQQKSREKMRREFTANVSHELKTPLTSIMGTAELFSENLISGEDSIKFGKKIYNESYRLLNMIEDMIKLSMLDENIVMNFEKIELSQIILNVIAELKVNAANKNLEITHKLEEVEINGVRSLIHDLFYNLIDNAIKYNKEDGFVEVRINKAGDKIIVLVKDSGIGIKSGEFNNIFERFYRVDKSRSKESGGSGLGLSIVKHIALIHNANVEVSSDGKDKGSEFKIIFKETHNDQRTKSRYGLGYA